MNETTNHMADITEEWALLDEDGGTVVVFTNFMEFSLSSRGQTVFYTIAEGSFANYHKIELPPQLRVTLGLQGSASDFEYALNKLEEYKREAVKLSVVTPSRLYDSMTLVSYTDNHDQASGANMLLVKLVLVEVREAEPQAAAGAITSPRNPTSASKVDVDTVRAMK